jgi:hypothetical protein
MPWFSEIRLDAVFAIALGMRITVNPSVSNQKSFTHTQASLISPCPRHGTPSQKPRLSSSPFIRLIDPMIWSGRSIKRSVQCQASPLSAWGSAMSRQ